MTNTLSAYNTPWLVTLRRNDSAGFGPEFVERVMLASDGTADDAVGVALGRHIVALDDPTEYELRGVKQA